jgi:Asp-tRNA(Asn)/Glu-tRNA(Gln) amidotransferase A subunit family amidase
MPEKRSLQIAELRKAFLTGDFSASELIDRMLAYIADWDDPAVWITRLNGADLRQSAAELDAMAASDPDVVNRLPLFGIPFAVKDNIDIADMPTTAACPAFAYIATETAPVVKRLLSAGAVLVGKTNLDQFATGHVGTRSPYGVLAIRLARATYRGGSSSGSAVAVAAGLVSFALGTDTAGSGRVPAAFNNVVGLKPSRGLISTRGVVPACRSLDCVSIFTLTAQDAAAVFDVAAGFDAGTPSAALTQNAAVSSIETCGPSDRLDPSDGRHVIIFAFGGPFRTHRRRTVGGRFKTGYRNWVLATDLLLLLEFAAESPVCTGLSAGASRIRTPGPTCEGIAVKHRNLVSPVPNG